MPEIDEKYGRNVRSVVLGDIIIRPWYSSLYREDLVGSTVIDPLYVCPLCFKYTVEEMFHAAHMEYPHDIEVPGTMIYQKDRYAIYEVDGGRDWLFTTNISLFAKLFIDNKSVCFDVEGFMYYLLVDREATPTSSRTVGFFSKEKLSWDNNNLACIVVFPPWQKKGLGQILMGASYEIGKKNRQIGGPERPLSKPGERGYLSHWSCAIARFVMAYSRKGPITISAISEETCIRPEDIIHALKHMNVLGSRRKNGSYSLQKRKVREWVDDNHVNIASPVDPEAFIDTTTTITNGDENRHKEEAEEEKAEAVVPEGRKSYKKRKRAVQV